MARTQPPNPNVPVGGQVKPIIPPNQRLPFIDPNTGVLTPYGMQFLQQLYAALQGDNGIFDLVGDLSAIPPTLLEDTQQALIEFQPFIQAPLQDPVPSLSLYAVGNTTNSTTSYVNVNQLISVSGAGNVSVGLSNSSLIISGAAGGGGATSGNLFALGNTTAASSSTTVTLTSLTFSGAGGVSVGYSTTAAGNGVIVISGATPAGSATSMGLTAVGNTAGTTSSMTQAITGETFSGGGIVSVGYDAGSIVISATSAAQTAPTLSVFALGNTVLGTSQVVAPGSLSFEGVGVASVGVTGSTVFVVAPDSGSDLNRFALGNTTGSTSSDSVTLTAWSISGAGGASVGFSGNTLVIAGQTTVAQTAQTLGLFAVGNTAGSTTSQTVDARTVSFEGSGVASVGFSNGSIVINAPAAAATNPQLSIYAVGNTTDSTTSGLNAAGSLSFDGAGAVSVGISGSSVVISAPIVTTAAQTAAGLNIYAVGNTTTSTTSGAIQAGSLSFDGAGAVSVGVSGSSVIISAPVVTTAASGTEVNRFAIGNTAGSTTSDTAPLTNWTFSGLGGASVGLSGSTIVISGATTVAQSVQTIGAFATGNTTGSSSSTTFDARSFTVSGAGGASVGYSSNNILIISGATTTPQTAQTLGLFAVGNTAGSTTSQTVDARTVSFEGSGVASVGFSNGSIVINAPAAAATNPLFSIYAVGNTTDSTTSGVNAAGSLSFDGAGGVSVGVSGSSVVISGVTTVASATADNLFALGNTTGATSSTTQTLTNFSVSGAGGVSVGFSTTAAGAGVMVISGATTAASATSMTLVAIGNTTGSSSATTRVITAETLSGAGIVSVGYTGNSIIISASTAATNPLLSVYAVGNTTTSASSGVIAAGSLSFDGAGIVSVGISGSSVIISAPAGAAASATSMGFTALGNTTGTTSSMTQAITAESISFSGGVSGGFNAGTFIISAAAPVTLTYWEPRPAFSANTHAAAAGTMSLIPVTFPEVMSMNQVRFIASRALGNPSLSVTSSVGASGTATASAAHSVTEQFVRYRETAAGQFASTDSTSIVNAITWSWSVSRSGASNTASCTMSFAYANGSSLATSTMSNTASSAAVATYAGGVLNASTSNFINLMATAIPWATSFPASFYVFGHMIQSSASATATGQTWMTAAAGSWTASFATMQGFAALPIRAGPGFATSPAMPYGAGQFSVVGSTVPASFAITNLSSEDAAGVNIPWVEFGAMP